MQTLPRRALTAGVTMLTALLAVAAVTGPVAAVGGVSTSIAPSGATGASAVVEAPWRSAARASMLAAIQDARAATGLVAYVRDPALDDVAQARVDHLAAIGAFGHTAAGTDILTPVEATGVRPYAAGEAQGWAGDDTMDAALARIRGLWFASPSHRAIVLADWASYAGIGLTTDGTRTLVVLLVADTPDRTAPTIAIEAATRAGSTVTVRWSAADPRLQARTAGVGSVVVEWRADGGGWRTARTAVGATATRIGNAPTDRGVDIRVRARDRAGNLSPWVTERVPVLP
jgi:uncharacterized protein YkwD